MATNEQMVDALIKAAEEILGRKLTRDERNQLVKLFNAEQGTRFERAQRGIAKFASLSEQQLHEKVAASDNADREMQELANILKEWKPGS